MRKFRQVGFVAAVIAMALLLSSCIPGFDCNDFGVCIF